MNILLINQYYPPDPAPTGQFLADLAGALIHRGHNVRVICSRQGYQGGESPLGKASDNCPVELVNNVDQMLMGSSSAPPSANLGMGHLTVCRVSACGFGRKSRLGRIADYASFFLTALQAAWRGPRPDVVVCLTTPPYIGLIGLSLRWLRGVRVIQWIMDLYPDAMIAHGMLRPTGFLVGLLRWLTRIMLRGSDAVWTLGPYMQEKLAAYLFPQPAISIKNDLNPPDPVHPVNIKSSNNPQSVALDSIPLWAGLEVEKSSATTPSVGLTSTDATSAKLRQQDGYNGHLTVMYSGNMGLGHEFTTLLDAVTRMNGSANLQYLFVGGGPRAEEVQRQVSERQLPNFVFQSYAPRDKLAESLAMGDIHLVSQLPEWQGIIVPSKLAGIFAIGRPVIFVGGIRNEIAAWIRQADAGFILEPGDVAGLVRVLQTLQSQPQMRERLGQNARNFYLTHLASDINLPKLIASIERLS